MKQQHGCRSLGVLSCIVASDLMSVPTEHRGQTKAAEAGARGRHRVGAQPVEERFARPACLHQQWAALEH